jgi:hypothetical protein
LLLLTALIFQNGGVFDRPLIFIGHSFGGLVIEQAVVKASSAGSPYEYLARLLGGVILLGTPHQSSKFKKWSSVMAHLADLVEYDEAVSLEDVDEKSTFDLIYEFAQIMIRTDLYKTKAVMCFCEDRPTKFLWRGRLVEQMSALV